MVEGPSVALSFMGYYYLEALFSSYNIPGLAPGVLVTFSMLLTETSEISKSILHLDLSGDKCLK